MVSRLACRISFILFWVHIAGALPPTYLLNNDNDPETDVVAILPPKDYLPREIDSVKSPVIPSRDDDTTYLLSKLSNQELISLLNDKSKKEKFDMKDVMKISANFKNNPDLNDSYRSLKKETKAKGPVSQVQSQNHMAAYFRLDDKEVQQYNFKADADPNYLAHQKIKNLLYSRPSNQDLTGLDSDAKKELLFDMLVAQLKKLCCQSSKLKKNYLQKQPSKALLDKVLPNKAINNKNDSPYKYQISHEHMFLIINDNINEDESDDLITVDPDSLSKNSSVLLLGPITTPLAENQLKLVMTRITNELSKPDYLPLFQQIAEGTLSESNTRLVKSLVKGPETRRYIKPHRCNHQSKLAKIYNGPKWIICTGYLNLNTPSLYD